MRRLLTPLGRAETYRDIAFFVSALPFGIVSLVVLIVGWGVTLGLVITPLVVPLLVGLWFVVRQLAKAEAFLARELLRAHVALPSQRGPGGFWRRLQHAVSDGAFWKQQAYLLLRVVLGWPLAILHLALLGFGGWAIALPLTNRWLEDGDVVGRRVDTFAEALVFVPVGLAALIVLAHLTGPLGRIWAPIASRLLGGDAIGVTSLAQTAALRRRWLAIFAGGVGAVGLLLTVIWAFSTPGEYFWPLQAILPPALAVAIAAWVVLVLERPEIERRTADSRALAIHAGVSAIVWLYIVAEWALAAWGGYFWPKWVLLGLGIALAIHAVVAFAKREHAHSHRIRTLQETRAGAVDVQETELRRIERDLHDGAQARLVALGMSIGMAEEKLATDPEGARLLLAEARAGAREALEELRDLARGIHPPILTDRGLDAAIRALAARTPLRVDVSVELSERPRPPVETAAYFVVAEALANAGKYANADRVAIGVHVSDGMLVAEVRDDGDGGADAAGKGLTGLRRRVEALDGSLRVTSPAGGPTTVRAELPCGS
jgi:signal transduction histidine kinase